MMKQKAQESLESQENVDAKFIIVAWIHIIWSSNNPRIVVILMGKGPVEAKYMALSGGRGAPYIYL